MGTAYFFHCAADRNGCGYDIPVNPDSAPPLTIACPKCSKRWTDIYLQIGARAPRAQGAAKL